MFLLLAVAAFAASFHSEWLFPDKAPQVIVRTTESRLGSVMQDFEQLTADSQIIHDLIENRFRSSYFPEILSRPYGFLIYKNGEPILWNNNKALPPAHVIHALTGGSYVYKLPGGYYEIAGIRKTDSTGHTYTIIRSFLLKHNFPVQNRHIQNTFNPLLDIPAQWELSLTEVPKAFPVRNSEGKPLFYLQPRDNPISTGRQMKVALYYLSLGFLLMAVAYIARMVSAFSAPGSFVLLAALLGAIRWGSLMANYPTGLYDMELFSPQLYASSSLNKSLGDLSINLLLLFWVVVYFYRHVSISLPEQLSRAARFILYSILFLIVFGSSRLSAFLFKSLLIDSKIPFAFHDLASFNIYSVIALGCITIGLAVLALTTVKAFRTFSDSDKKLVLWSGVTASAIYLAVLITRGSPWLEYAAALAIMLILVVLHSLVSRRVPLSTPSNMIVLLMPLCMFATIYLNYYSGAQDLLNRKNLARKLSTERDLATEFLFLDVQGRILEDPFIRNYFIKPFISTQEITDRIRIKYFSGFFRKYDVSIYTLNPEGRLFRSAPDAYLELLNEEQISRAQQTLSDFLYYIPKPYGSYAYISNLPIIYQGKLVGSIVLELIPKTYSQKNLYPELLLEEKIKPPENMEHYSYALYSDGILVKHHGEYSYPFHFSFFSDTLPEVREFKEVGEGSLKHLIYRSSDNKYVVITDKDKTMLAPFSLFSYLFCIYLVAGILLISLRYLVLRLLSGRIPLPKVNLTFRDKIQFSLIITILSSFFFIGYYTISNIVKEYKQSHMEYLMNKSLSVRTAIEYILKEDTTILTPYSIQASSPIDLSALSDIENIDINIYSPPGMLTNTSQPEIFDKGLLSPLMDPTAYLHSALENKVQFIQSEHIGSLNFISIYSPIRNNDGTLLGYLNLPYFARERELNNEIASLLVTLVNVYVLLLVLAGILAYFLSDSITRSFRIISEKLNLIQLGKKNEPIEWKSNDEIGSLIAEYNRMLVELEKSAQMLAKSERESAWREMAKQIAHEIKNPLTPMKLSIQHLQRTMAEGDPRSQEIAKKVCETLIEQIDNLARIASEFSSFAKMPRAQNEVINLSDIITSAVNLFSEERDGLIRFTRPMEPVQVFCDRNQMLSVFNNLIKNAIQAIPPERAGQIIISLQQANGKVTVTIQDNGIGITPEQAEKVFIPNFTTKSGGTGLGLAITKEIIEAAGGRIWFESEAGKGTTFFIELPLYS
ncbi:MAG: hypothetical protein KatS3mg031_0139 [Chitinophagales bacterium]|nr:MAG: hypothetical protein KatS3mg031_0139 [Chitinophagales bacterium]